MFNGKKKLLVVSLFHEIIYQKKIISQLNNFCVYSLIHHLFSLNLFSCVLLSGGKGRDREGGRDREKEDNSIISDKLLSWVARHLLALITNHFSMFSIGHRFLY